VDENTGFSLVAYVIYGVKPEDTVGPIVALDGMFAFVKIAVFDEDGIGGPIFNRCVPSPISNNLNSIAEPWRKASYKATIVHHASAVTRGFYPIFPKAFKSTGKDAKIFEIIQAYAPIKCGLVCFSLQLKPRDGHSIGR
jgi:hypothetical protein